MVGKTRYHFFGEGFTKKHLIQRGPDLANCTFMTISPFNWHIVNVDSSQFPPARNFLPIEVPSHRFERLVPGSGLDLTDSLRSLVEGSIFADVT